MSKTTFVLTKKDGNQISRAETIVDMSADDLEKLIANLKASQPQQFGEVATIYVAPESYTMRINGQDMTVQPQFFPPEYGYIINELTGNLKSTNE
jgi:hypothetical protein